MVLKEKNKLVDAKKDVLKYLGLERKGKLLNSFSTIPESVKQRMGKLRTLLADFWRLSSSCNLKIYLYIYIYISLSGSLSLSVHSSLNTSITKRRVSFGSC